MQQRTGNKKPLWRVFSLKELHSATNNFNYDNKLSERGFDSVYWGQLWDGSQINFDLWVFLTILGLITIVVFFVMVNIVNLTQLALPAETTIGTCFVQHYIESILVLQEASSQGQLFFAY
ncbi:PTI1-like tyrosine-protein kinase [Glycine max]|nr:PTI1-like tyrosine-protein kinase [Glycine max]